MKWCNDAYDAMSKKTLKCHRFKTYMVSIKTLLKAMCDFLTLKTLPLTKQRIAIFLTHLSKNPLFQLELKKLKNSNFSCKMSIFWPLTIGNFLFWSTIELTVTFLGLKITNLLKKRFLEHPVIPWWKGIPGNEKVSQKPNMEGGRRFD